MALTTITKITDTVSQKTSDSRKLCIASDDVLMGRGARATENEGNVRFRQVVRNRLHDYLTAPRRQDKDQIAREILAVVKSRNGRFLRKVEGMDDSSSQGASDYAAVEDDVALLKVKQALRDQKLEESTNNSQQSGSLKNDCEKGVKSVDSPVDGSEAISKEKLVAAAAAGFLSPGVSHFPPSFADASDSLLLRMYLNEQQSRTTMFSQAMYPEASATSGLLASRLGLVTPGLSTAMLMQQARQEALLRSALQAQALQHLIPSPSLPMAGFPMGGHRHHLSPSLTSSIEAEARLNLLRSLSMNASAGLRRPADFQQVSDLLNAQRALKRHKAN